MRSLRGRAVRRDRCRTPSRRRSALVAGRLVRGRIDAVYAADPRRWRRAVTFLVVDWKTSRSETADPLQLAIYRLAWAEATGSRWSRWTRSSTTFAPTAGPARAALPDGPARRLLT